MHKTVYEFQNTYSIQRFFRHGQMIQIVGFLDRCRMCMLWGGGGRGVR